MAVHPLLAAARELTPLLQAQRAEAEELRRMTPEAHAAVAASGLYRALAPAEVGGFELSPPD